MINITTNNGAFLVEFDDNVLYLNDGTMGMPMSSMIVLSDESDIITFRRVGNNDVLFSAKYDEIELDGETFSSKEDAVEALGEALNQPTGGGGNPEKEVASISIANGGEILELLNSDDEVIASADTTVWLDGVEVDDRISTTSTNPVQNRVIAAELLTKQDDLIPGHNIELSGNIISSSQVVVLTQEEYDQLVEDQEVDEYKIYIISDATPVDVSQFVTSGWVETQLATKQDTLSAGTGITISGNVISASADLSDYYTKEEIDNAELATSAAINDLNYRLNNIDMSDYYTKEEIDDILGDINDALDAINGNSNS